MKISKAIFTVCIASLLAGCGGGEGEEFDYFSPPTYGSIAINQNSGAGGMATSYSSQSSANSNALKQCGNSCSTVLEFGSYMCGALARADNLAFGWASDRKKSSAEADAMSQCTSRNGIRCQIVLSDCNAS